MAGNSMQNTSSNAARSFDKELNDDINDFHLPPNSWTQARNAINNSKTGDLGKIGNEPSNLHCTDATYTIIGVIHLEADKWAIFSTDGSNSEIGVFIEDLCQYTTVVNDPCLNFSKEHLIKGQSRSTSDCNFEIYWDDGNNSSRFMPLLADDPTQNVYTNPNSPIPWIKSCSVVNGCNICVNTPNLDCDKIRVAKFITPPCIKIQNGAGAGTLPNGSYMVFAAYSIRGQKISDYYMSNVQALFNHDNTACSLDVVFETVDTDFSEMIIVLCSVVNGQTVARQAGIYSTHQTRLSFDVIQNSWPSVPIEQLPIITPVADRTDAMYNVGPYLIRVGPTSKQDFNYQPRANQIVAKWVSVEYPSDYYRKGGNQVGHMRDEIYPYFLRWIYDTGDKTASYHIPGRAPFSTDFNIIGNADAAPEVAEGLTPYNWRVYNTATVTSLAVSTLPDGGTQISEGYMGYWESSEIYPDDKPQIWNANIGSAPYPGTNPLDYNLCGKPIRHHRFPENNLHNTVNHFNSGAGTVIRVMGVKFENILPPVMNDGVTPVPGIVGFEILRGTRNGNRTIVAKGIINNMGTYTIEGGTTTRTGAYPNYPYNDLRPDPFLSTSKTSWNSNLISGGTENNYSAQSSFSRDMFTFHGPDTNFTNPYLASKEIKVYGEMNGNVVGKFDFSEKHPREKLITNFTFVIAALAGVGISSLTLNGQRRVKYQAPINPGFSVSGYPDTNVTSTANDTNTQVWAAPYGVGNVTGTGVVTTTGLETAIPGTMLQTSPRLVDSALIPIAAASVASAYVAYDGVLDSGTLLGLNFVGQTSNSLYTGLTGAYSAAENTSAAIRGSSKDVEQDDGILKNIPLAARVVAGAPIFLHYFTEGSDTALRLIKSLIRYRHFDLKYHSHGSYDTFVNPTIGNQRRVITNQQYIGPQLTDFTSSVRINNQYRSRCVAIRTAATISDPTVQDRTRYRVTDVPTLTTTDPTASEFGWPAFGSQSEQKASSHYVALKQRIRNQYGQLTNIVQLLIPCSMNPVPVDIGSTGVLFGGDTYIGRYTEKNTFFYFYDWLYGQPDGAQLDYLAHRMLPFPRYWANFDEFETGDFTTSIIPAITANPTNPNAWNATLPNSYYNMDGLLSTPSFMANTLNLKFSVQKAWFYLFNSGVRDFFVESEINLDLRDWGNQDSEVHYDPYRYTDTKALFDAAIIKSGNYYKYDHSLSVSKLFINYVSWGSTQLRDYDPYLAEACYVYRPKRAIYSLPSQFESRKDNWLIYLANNYYDFMNKVTCIKPINKNGAVIFFDAASPVQFLGSDQLEISSGNKLTIGDGGLFSQPLQNLINADRPYEYGSCQDRLSVVNTPAGVFWMSQNQGKVYNLTNGIDEISMQDLKWWFAQYLPYKLTEQFPNFELTDNPVIGIGCQSIYDNENQLVYFTKRDFVIKPTLAPGTTVTYVSADDFLVNGVLPIKLGDTTYFDNASWTVSYDPKTKVWLSRHDWHPNLLIPGKNTFMSVLDNGIWIHNQRCDSYCNYYGVDYPFEVEYMVNTVSQVNTLRSIEYMMEAYKYDTNCHDRFHFLDFNFDEAVIYNTEQCSGLLRLNLQPKNNPAAEIGYPIINPTFVDILYSKEENKYRFNQFWDITDDRGEFNPIAQRMIWNTEPNGYIRSLNPVNLNYNKSPIERKKFRHYTNSVLLRRRISGNVKILVSIATNKNLYSPR